MILKMKLRKNRLSVALALSLLLSSWGGSYASAAAMPTPDITPTQSAYGYFVDNYKKNNSSNPDYKKEFSNPTIWVLNEYLKLWTPGSDWNNGTKVNSSVLDANIKKANEIAAARTASEADAAYYDDRRNQTYAIADGLGSLTDVYRTLSGSTTTVNDLSNGAANDAGNDKGDPNSTLGNMVKLHQLLRGNYSSTSPAKDFYKYPRPYRWQDTTSIIDSVYGDPTYVVPSLHTRMSTSPSSDGGFPSGHNNGAYLAAIAMAYAVPERYQELMTRAAELGQNRIISGFHSPLDVMGGRITATALAAAILSDPANAAIKQAAYDDAHNLLLTQTGTAADRFNDYAKNKQDYNNRLTYDFSPINSTMNPMVVPKGAEVLLETRLPYLDDTQRRWVLATTGLSSGYPLLDDTEGWGRLNLFAATDGYGAFFNDITVTMDASKGGFNAKDHWRNDISGTGKLTKNGTGTLILQGNNTYSGGTQIDEGILEGDSETAFGSGNVVNNAGSVIENVYGKMTVGGSYSQSAGGTLELNLSGKDDLLEIKGSASLNGKLRLDFSNDYVFDNSVVTLITHGKDLRSGQFSSIETVGLPSEYKVKVLYGPDSIRLWLYVTNDTAAPSWPSNASLTGSNVGQTSLTLNWPAAVDNVEVNSYNVYRGSTLLGTVTGTTYGMTGLAQGTTYSFSVVANDLADNQGSPLIASLTTASGGYTSGPTPAETQQPAKPAEPQQPAKPDDTGESSTEGSSTKLFTDVNGTYSWANSAIEALALKGIIKGTSDEAFSPGKKITRADVVVLLVRALNLKADVTSNFIDVNESKYYYESLGIAKQLGLVSGKEGNTFDPNKEITRQDLMLLVARALKISGHDVQGNAADLSEFADSEKLAPYAVEGAASLVKMGIVKGSVNGINPLGTATRAETAVIIYRMLLLTNGG